MQARVIRKQLVLTKDENRALEQLATDEGCSQAECVRRGLQLLRRDVAERQVETARVVKAAQAISEALTARGLIGDEEEIQIGWLGGGHVAINHDGTSYFLGDGGELLAARHGAGDSDFYNVKDNGELTPLGRVPTPPGGVSMN